MNSTRRLLGALLTIVMLITTACGALAEDPTTTTTTASAPADANANGGGDTTTSTTDTPAPTTTTTTTTTTVPTTTTTTTTTPTTTTTTQAAPQTVSARVKLATDNDKLPLFKNPGSGELGQFPNGTIVTVLEKTATWSKVEIGTLTGYMQTAFLYFAGSSTGTAYYAYVKSDVAANPVPLHSTASTSSTGLGVYYTGTRVQVLDMKTDWTRVLIDGKEGYMQTKYLSQSVQPTTVPGGTVVGYAVVNNPDARDKLNLRAKATTGSTSLGRFANGTQVKILEKGDPWCYVEIGTQKGYMMTKFLTFTSLTPTPTPAVTYYPYPTPTPGGVIHYATVNNSNPRDKLNLRAMPDLNSQVLGRFANGTQIKVTSLDTIWCAVEVGGLRGYMMTQYLAFSNSNNNNNNNNTNNGTVVANALVNNPVATQRLNLRAGPSTGYQSLGLYANGTQVKVYSKGAEWSQVEVGGKAGYMMTSYLSFNGTTNTTNPTVGVVKNPIATQRLNLRAFPNKSSSSLGQFYNGTRVKILSYDTVWCQVDVNGVKGYMMTQYLSLM